MSIKPLANIQMTPKCRRVRWEPKAIGIRRRGRRAFGEEISAHLQVTNTAEIGHRVHSQVIMYIGGFASLITQLTLLCDIVRIEPGLLHLLSGRLLIFYGTVVLELALTITIGPPFLGLGLAGDPATAHCCIRGHDAGGFIEVGVSAGVGLEFWPGVGGRDLVGGARFRQINKIP